MDNYCAPQWVDFSSSPQVPCDDYFEKFHDIYQPKVCTDVTKNNVKIRKKICEITETPKKSMQLQVKDFIKSTPNLNENYRIEIDNLKKTPIKVIDTLRHGNGKHKVLQEVTYDNVLLEAIQNIQLGENLQKVTKKMDLSLPENIFKKPLPLKNKTSKPVKTSEMDKCNISISSKNEEEIKSQTSNVNMIKRHKDSSIKITENNHPKVKVDNKNVKLKSSTAKQQTSLMQVTESKNENTVNRPVKKQIQLQHNSKDSSVTLRKIRQKNVEVSSTESLVKRKQISRSCSSINQEKVSCQKRIPYQKIISTVVANNESEIIIKKEKVLFFDIPIHTKQKKVTRPVPFSFESRDKIKKQLKLEQESKNNKSEPVTNVKLVSDFNKAQKKGVTSFINNSKIGTGKDKIVKQSKQNEKVHKFNTRPITMHKPMRVISAPKDNNYEKTVDKIEKKKSDDTLNKKDIKKERNALKSISCTNIKSGDILNKKDINKERNSLKSISCKNIHINKNSKIQAKETLQTNKYIPKENKQSNINVSTKVNNNSSQDKGIKLKSAIVTSGANDRGKKREFEERIKLRRIMYEEKLKKEKEAKLAKEKAEISKLRRQAEIKANPMPAYMPLIHIKSTKPLTQPQSPAWSTKHRVSRIRETS